MAVAFASGPLCVRNLAKKTSRCPIIVQRTAERVNTSTMRQAPRQRIVTVEMPDKAGPFRRRRQGNLVVCHISSDAWGRSLPPEATSCAIVGVPMPLPAEATYPCVKADVTARRESRPNAENIAAADGPVGGIVLQPTGQGNRGDVIVKCLIRPTATDAPMERLFTIDG